MQELPYHLKNYLLTLRFSPEIATYVTIILMVISTILIVFIVDFILKKIFLKAIHTYFEKSKSHFDDYLIKHKVVTNIAHIIPLIIVIELIPIIFFHYPIGIEFILRIVQIVLVILIAQIINGLLKSFKKYFRTVPSLKDKPIASYMQILSFTTWVIFLFASVAILFNISVWKLFTLLGTTSAIVILVFKDTIMGFVASIQVSINDLVRIGDWITIEKYGADGDVTEINLSTVKIRNFDNTITTIPTYTLVSDSFKNWRGMDESGGRRIKRAIIIQQNSIKYLSKVDVEKLIKIDSIANYLKDRESDIDEYNKEQNVNKELLINGRNLTNFGVYRKYIDTYLNSHSAINKDLTIMTRQLSPTAQGIPLEIYAFTSDKRWKNYEYIMADIFDHLIAATPYFELKIFEFSNKEFYPSIK